MAREVLTPAAVYALVKSVANRPIPVPNAIAAVAIVLKESGGDTGAVNINSNGSTDRGLWQWNNRAWPNITDAMAFDKTIATQKAWEVSNGFSLTGFGPWIGHGATTLTEEFQRNQNNRTAYANAQTAVGSGGAPTVGVDTTGWTDAEIALVRTWDSDNDGKVEKEDITAADKDLAESLDIDDRIAINDAIAKHKSGKKLSTGWLVDANAAAASVGVSAGPALSAQIKQNVINSMTTGGGVLGIFVDLGQIFTGIAGAPAEVLSDAADALAPEWLKELGRLLQILGTAAFWKRIGIGALGLLVVLVAIVFYNRDKVAAIATKGMVNMKKAPKAATEGAAE